MSELKERPGRDVWLPEFSLTPINTMGSAWPDAVIVEKWERNDIGERRWVDTEMYYHHPTSPTT